MKFVLPMPPSINQTYGVSSTGKNRMYKRKAVKEWETEAGWEVKQQLLHQLPKTYYKFVFVYIDWFYGQNRDIDAGIKVLLDLFQKQGVYPDDMQIISLTVTKSPANCSDDIKPRVEVLLSDHALD